MVLWKIRNFWWYKHFLLQCFWYKPCSLFFGGFRNPSSTVIPTEWTSYKKICSQSFYSNRQYSSDSRSCRTQLLFSRSEKFCKVTRKPLRLTPFLTRLQSSSVCKKKIKRYLSTGVFLWILHKLSEKLFYTALPNGWMGGEIY